MKEPKEVPASRGEPPPNAPSVGGHDVITLAHGNGGRRMRELIDGVFATHLGGAHLDTEVDAARLVLSGEAWATSVDGFIVEPLEFPGGDIGALAVHGTVNDLAVSGAEPVHLTLAAFLEEGLPVAVLDRLVQSLARAAKEDGVTVVAGDTKVVPRGHGGGVYFATTGLGRIVCPGLSARSVRPGDALVVSGPIGDHGIAVLLARESFDLRGDLRSDCASVLPLCRAVWDLPGLRFLRDPTRGGLATVAHEVARAAGATVLLEEDTIPVREPVRGVCELLGYDPAYLACEGRVVAVVAEAEADVLLLAWRRLPGGAEAKRIGRVETGPARAVVVTSIGGRRVLDELEDDPLPRIC